MVDLATPGADMTTTMDIAMKPGAHQCAPTNQIFVNWCHRDKFMTFNPDIHHRHSIRLKDYDYTQAGAYFVTICTWQRECLFGEIADGAMVLNDLGRIAADEWERTPKMRTNVELDVWTIMPNHFHGVIFIHDTTNVGAHCMRPDLGMRTEITGAEKMGACNAPLRRQSGSLGSVVAGFKSATTKRINTFRNNSGYPLWQRNFYERVIRNDHDLSRAREYIVNNPMKWALDKENQINCT